MNIKCKKCTTLALKGVPKYDPLKNVTVISYSCPICLKSMATITKPGKVE